MKQIEFLKDGIRVGDTFIELSTIIENCNNAKIKEDKLFLLKMEWYGWRGFDEGVLEEIILPIEKINIIKKYITGREIYFGEIAGKHSEIYNTLDEDDINVIDDQYIITKFLKKIP